MSEIGLLFETLRKLKCCCVGPLAIKSQQGFMFHWVEWALVLTIEPRLQNLCIIYTSSCCAGKLTRAYTNALRLKLYF
jgi:hypothetical protein